MSFLLYMDEHVPSAITQGRRQRGIDVLTVQEDGRLGAEDSDLLNRSTELQRVMFTRDTDFLRETSRRQKDGIEFTGVIYAHQLAATIGNCIADLELLATECDLAEFTSRLAEREVATARRRRVETEDVKRRKAR